MYVLRSPLIQGVSSPSPTAQPVQDLLLPLSMLKLQLPVPSDEHNAALQPCSRYSPSCLLPALLPVPRISVLPSWWHHEAPEEEDTCAARGSAPLHRGGHAPAARAMFTGSSWVLPGAWAGASSALFQAGAMGAQPCLWSSAEPKGRLHRVRSFWAPRQVWGRSLRMGGWGLCPGHHGAGSRVAHPRPLCSSRSTRPCCSSSCKSCWSAESSSCRRWSVSAGGCWWWRSQPAPSQLLLGMCPGAPSPHGSPRVMRGSRSAKTPIPWVCWAGQGRTNALFCLAIRGPLPPPWVGAVHLSPVGLGSWWWADRSNSFHSPIYSSKGNVIDRRNSIWKNEDPSCSRCLCKIIWENHLWGKASKQW